MKHAVFRYVEAELYDYHETKKALEELRADIIEAAPPEKIGGNGSDYHGDPTAVRAGKLLTNRRIRKMEETTGAIDRVLNRLPPEKRALVKVKYWDGRYSNLGVADQIHISRATFFRWRDEIVFAVAVEMGLANVTDRP